MIERPRISSRALWAPLLLLAAVGCAREMVTVRRLDPNLGLASSPWIDHTRAELEAAWGQPEAIQPDGEGGSILEYKRDKAFRVDTGDNPTTPENDAPVLYEDINRKTVARFWVDDGGKIYRVWMDSKLWEKGYPLPGSGSASPESAPD